MLGGADKSNGEKIGGADDFLDSQEIRHVYRSGKNSRN